MTTVYVVMPGGVDDPGRPSGGNTYDRRLCDGLAELGWRVRERPVPGAWPHPDPSACSELAAVLAAAPEGAVVLLDGLIASTVPDALAAEAGRLRLVVLVHMPLAGERERAALSAAAGVVTTSSWTRDWLLGRYPLAPGRVHVAEPGVDAAGLAAGTAVGGELICVATVTPDKGHDVLLAALTTLVDLTWRCVCVGSLDRDPGFVERLGHQARESGIADRVLFTGPRVGADLGTAYSEADLLVLASRAETYGMVVTEALARGLPVVAADVGGVAEALGRAADGSRPGLLVPPDDAAALAASLRCWLEDEGCRARLRDAARDRRTTLAGWSTTARHVARVLAEVAG